MLYLNLRMFMFEYVNLRKIIYIYLQCRFYIHFTHCIGLLLFISINSTMPTYINIYHTYIRVHMLSKFNMNRYKKIYMFIMCLLV